MSKPSALVVTGQLLQDISVLEERSFWKFVFRHPEYLSLTTDHDFTKIIAEFKLFTQNEFWKYVADHVWAAKAIDLFDQTRVAVLWGSLIELLPGNYREPVTRPEALMLAINLYRFMRTAEEISGKKVVSIEEGTLTAQVKEFLPPTKGWARFQKLPKQSRLRNLVREAYVLRYLGQVKLVAGRMSLKFPKNVDADDLYAEGLVGLLEAIDGFDPARGIKFETFSVYRIRGAILDSLRSSDWVPRSVRTGSRQKNLALMKLQHKLGREPFLEELSEETGLSAETILELYENENTGNIKSIFEQLFDPSEDKPYELIDNIESHAFLNPEEACAREDMYEFLRVGIKEYLTLQEYTVIYLYYWEDKVLREIGRILKISESRTSQIHTKALGVLRTACNDRFGIPIIISNGNGGHRIATKQNLPCYRYRVRRLAFSS
ncbi:MAG: RNA polymerase sigma factor for flagellar operon FliA [Parcubacteria group bacterium Gr01-1014_20]|nr:MAG: RNA polymerase sigma factor for flagellar operon FliA [Parcubacteria group bacterium Gr01-1014_20]